MLSLKTWKSASDAATYYTHEQTQLEYYAGNNEHSGTYRGLEVLGIKDGSPTDQKSLDHFLKGFDLQGRSLTQRNGKNHRPGYDLTFSAPKSVSILWALGDESTKKMVLESHKIAVEEALNHIEKYAAKTRRGKNGCRIETVKNLMLAKFDHATSRENDPQLHTHCLLFNIAQRKDGKFGTIESRYIFEEAMAAGAIYQAELGENLERKLACNIQKKGNNIEISGVSDDLIKTFSTRRAQIEEALEQKGFSSAHSASIAALETRAAKTKIPLEKLQENWSKKGKNFNQSMIIGRKQGQKMTVDFDETFEEITAFKSTFTDRDIRKALALKVEGITGREGFEGYLRNLYQSKELLIIGHDKQGNTRYTTQKMHQIEKNMLETVLKRQEEQSFLATKSLVDHEIKLFQQKKSKEIGKKIMLTDEQKAMVYELTTQKGGVKIALGIAGSGKSFSLEVAKNVWKKMGFEVSGMAPTGKASLGLQEGTGIKSATIDRFLVKKDLQNQNKKSVLVVDEAGMVGSRKLAKLVEFAQKNDSKLVLVGDLRQLQPVEAGSATKLIERNIGSFELKEIYRQQTEWQKKATEFFASGKATEALKAYDSNGCLEVFSSPEFAHECLVQDYISELKSSPDMKKIIIAETNHQIKILNKHIRSELVNEKKLDDFCYKINIKTGKDELEKRDFRLGDRILFTKNNQKIGVTNGTFGVITGLSKQIRGHQFEVQTDGGKMVIFNSKDYKNIEYGYAVTVYKSQGDTVDKTYFLLSEKTGREGAYVAMSRHRNNAKIYLDRSCFSELIDWNKLKNVKVKEQKIEKIKEKSIQSAAQKAAKTQQKDTSLDYKLAQKPAKKALRNSISR